MRDGRLRLHPTSVALVPLLLEVSAAHAPLATVPVRVWCDPALTQMEAWVDANRLYQVRRLEAA